MKLQESRLSSPCNKVEALPMSSILSRTMSKCHNIQPRTWPILSFKKPKRMSHRLHWGRRIQKEKSPKAKVKHWKKPQRDPQRVKSTQRERTCFDFQPRWLRQKRREKWFTSADVFLARKSLKRQVGEFVRKKNICVKQCPVQKWT